MKKHKGDFANCNHCQSYVRLGRELGDETGYAKATYRLHQQASAKRQRYQVMRDCGLKKTPFGWE